jgi:hypothetical protein
VKRTVQSLGQNKTAFFTPLLDLQKGMNYTAEHWTSATKTSAVYTTILSYKQYLYLHKLHTSPPTTVIKRECIKCRCIMFRNFSVVNTTIATKITDYQQTREESIHFIHGLFFPWRCEPTRVMASSFLRFSRSHTTTHNRR